MPSPCSIAHSQNHQQVGPLPIEETAELLPLEFCYSSGRNYVANPLAYQNELQLWALSMVMGISDITQALLGNVRSTIQWGAMLNSLVVGSRYFRPKWTFGRR
jgi:hypothetical protein